VSISGPLTSGLAGSAGLLGSEEQAVSMLNSNTAQKAKYARQKFDLFSPHEKNPPSSSERITAVGSLARVAVLMASFLI
jgi:hypothetical protein